MNTEQRSKNIFTDKIFFCYLLHLKPFKNDEKCFFFILKALSVLKIFKFLSSLFGQVGKKA